MMRPRLISKEEAKIVSGAGGVIGIWTHLAKTPLAYAQNICAIVDVVGIDHVCIGTDTKLTLPYRSPSDFGGGGSGGPPPGANPPGQPDSAMQNKRPPNMPNNGKRVGERTNEAWAEQETGFYYAIIEAMLTTGFSETEIAAVGGGNYCRVFQAATTGH